MGKLHRCVPTLRCYRRLASVGTLPGDGLRRGAPLHGALRAVPALAGHRRPAGRGSPGQRHLPGALLPDQGPPTPPTNHRRDFQRGLFVVAKGSKRILIRLWTFPPTVPSLSSVCMATRWRAAVHPRAPADGSGWCFSLHDQGHLHGQHDWEQVRSELPPSRKAAINRVLCFPIFTKATEWFGTTFFFPLLFWQTLTFHL